MTRISQLLSYKTALLTLAIGMGVGSITATPAQAGFRVGIDIREPQRPMQRDRDYDRHDDRDRYDHEGRWEDCSQERVWVPAIYRTECQRVWVEPTCTSVTEKVWVPEIYEDREILHRSNGREWHEHVRVVIAPAHYEVRTRQVETSPGHWEERPVQVLVSGAHWEVRPIAQAPRRDPRDSWSFEFGQRW